MALRIPGRVVFLVPWPDHWIVGTTDSERGPLERPRAGADEVDELLGTVNAELDVRLTRDDVAGTYAGLRNPVVGERVSRHPNGLVRISGGRYTTYRVTARRTVDAAVGRAAARSRTANLPIRGALARVDLKVLADRLASDGLDARAARSVVERHGSEAEAVVDLGRARGLLGRLSGEADHLEVEVVHAVRAELARSVDDVLARRMRLAPQVRDRGASIAPRVAELIASELGWDAKRQAREVAAYLDSAEREYGVPAR